jgi:hypothetical protein
MKYRSRLAGALPAARDLTDDELALAAELARREARPISDPLYRPRLTQPLQAWHDLLPAFA